jgi:Cof subfamily protein (haloacid dehalogenase superfamily)
MIKLIASDMDGTLLNENGKLPEEFFDVYKSMSSKNVLFAAASGRQYYTLAKDFNSIKDEMVFIAENGAFVVYQNEELYSCYVDPDIVHEVIKAARKIDDVQIMLCGKKAAYVEKTDHELIDQAQKYYARNQVVDDLLDVEDDILKLALYDLKGSANNSNKIIAPLFSEKSNVIVSSEFWLDILNNNVSKGNAIKHIQDKLNINFEETMTFGDYFNDIEMLQNAKHSYAMANAPEDVKKHAKHIAKSNREDGVMHVIKNMLLKA